MKAVSGLQTLFEAPKLYIWILSISSNIIKIARTRCYFYLYTLKYSLILEYYNIIFREKSLIWYSLLANDNYDVI